MNFPQIIRLPFFIKPLNQINNKELWDIPYIWPGFSDKVIGDKILSDHKFWNPAWPFSSAVADRILFEYRNLKNYDLEVLLRQVNEEASKKILEKSSLSYEEELAIYQFEQNGNSDSIFADYSIKKQEIKEEAHRLLILIWRLNELQHDIEEILNTCEQQSTNIFQAFKDPLQEFEDVLRERDELEKPARELALITPYNFLTDFWKMCLANILLFIPEKTAIFAEGEMARDLASLLDFKPVKSNLYAKSISLDLEGYKLLGAKAKPLDILQKSIFPRLKYFPQEYLIERQLLISDTQN